MGILSEILDSTKLLIQKGVTPKIYFDLDSTLFDVKPRMKKVIKEFADLETTLQKFPVAAKVLKAIEHVAESYHLHDHLKFFGLDDHPRDLHKALFNYWNDHFFHSDYLVVDEPYEGAVEYVNGLYQAGAEIIYLTGRDTERMLKGSVISLKKWGFPVDVSRALLVLKPGKELDDAEFKRDHFSTLKDIKVPVWFFENEPHNIHLILRDCPNVKIIYFESVHSGKSLAPQGLPIIRDFNLR